ncbi:2-dehydro-3-deoxygluconokinase [Paenibacillus antibioticophila]|uniref:2-dehydro-3-deoxygluconokinase n=1 Tax=Paenibacillus antibioticophila TaxID=1274374 RepID=A0A919XN84_9BACL|nr:sugar kinase [Paenibacillus antibioticophila]GIO35869.1 2-dehydro-3-deoxygluconokinase [Paenibacillus antibioticophila]
MPKTIAAFGEVMMRLQVPGFDLLSQSNTLNYSFSGTGVNVASALSRFGHTGYLVSRLPDNPLGDAALSSLHRLGIRSDYITRGGSYLGLYFLENGFGMRPSRVTYSNRQESSFNTAPKGTYDLEQIASGIDAIHFCGITLAMNDQVREHMLALARAVKQHGGLVVFDCNYRPSLWGAEGYVKAKPLYEQMLELSDIVFMNEKDVMLTLGRKTAAKERIDQLYDLLPQVAADYQIKVLAGTHRHIHGDNRHSLQGFMLKKGAFTFSEKLTFSVHDRIGAGDAYASGILHGELSDYEPEKTVNFAAAAALLAHTVSGDTPMSSEQDVFKAMHSTAGDVER